MSENTVVVESTKRRLSAIWLVPLVALILGVWLAVDAYLGQGPTVTIRFADADGIQAEKTLVKIRNVTIGLVRSVRLAGDMEGVVVVVDLQPEARSLLKDDSEFWVMKAEIRGASVSGLGTLLSGAYIEMAPGLGEVTRRRDFAGLDTRPASPVGTPGLHLQLVSNSSGSVSVGSPILYRGYEVGQVEHIELDVETRRVVYSIFVDAPFDQLLSSGTRFWNSSGISAELNSEGIKVSMGSLQSALSGGVAFDLPKNSKQGRPIASGMTFRLYPNESSIHEDPYRRSINYVVAFEQSLRGLHPGAPVTYRGIRIGSVIRIMLKDLNADPLQTPDAPIPVLIKIEPGRLALEDSPEGEAIAEQSIATAVDIGLRATLESGNLLTGAMFVELDFYEVDEPESLGEFADYPRIPSITGGFAHIQGQISQLLDKLNELPIEGTLLTLEKAVEELRGTLVATRTLFENDGMQQLPMNVQTTLHKLNDVLDGFSTDSAFQSELNRTLVELKSTLQSVESVTDQLAEKPNSLVFPTKQSADPEPKVAP